MRVRRSRGILWAVPCVGIALTVAALSAMRSMQQDDANRQLLDNIWHGSPAEVTQALDAGADPNATEKYGARDPGELVSQFVQSLLGRAPHGISALGQAINGVAHERRRHSAIEMARLPRHWQSYEKGLGTQPMEKARILLEHHADPNRGYLQSNPLIHAIGVQDTEMVRLLLQFHADPNARATTGLSALDVARQSRNASILALLNSSQTAQRK